MEVPPGEHGLVVGEDERIVGAGVELHLEHATKVVDRIVAGTVHLGGAAQGVGVLHAVAEDVRFGDLAALRQGKDSGGRGDLARMRPRRVDAWIEGGARTAERLDAERRHDVRRHQEPLRIVEHQAGGSGHEMCAVEHAERVLGPQLDGLKAGGAQRLGTAAPFTLVHDVAFPDQHQADVRRRCEVAAGAQRSLFRHPRTDIVVEQVDQLLRNRRAHPRGPLAELVDPDQHAGAHQLIGERRSDADRVAHEEVALKLSGVRRWNAHVLQRPHAGRQAVDHPILGDQPVDQRAGALQAGFRLRPQADAVAMAGHRHHVGGAQRLAVECH